MCDRRHIQDNEDVAGAALHHIGSDLNSVNSASEVQDGTRTDNSRSDATGNESKSSSAESVKSKTSQRNKSADKESNPEKEDKTPFKMVLSNATYLKWLEKEMRAFEPMYFRQPPTKPNKKYNIMRLLGKGGFGSVLLVNVENGGTLYAMKVMSKEEINVKRVINYVIAERRTLSAVHHPLIMSLIESLQDNSNIYLVMPFIECGNLLQLMRSTNCRRFNYKEAKFYLAQVVLCLEYLHRMRILYRDLKPENLMLEMTGYIKLTDFGFAKLLDAQRERTYSTLGTIAYMAPEVLNANNCGYSYSADWWAAGCLLYEFVVGCTPFSTVAGSELSMIKKVMSSEVQYPSTIRSDVKQLVSSLCQKNPHNRMGCQRDGAAAVRQHEFFSDMNFICLFNKQLPAPQKLASKYEELYYTGQPVPAAIVRVQRQMHLKAEFEEF